ncbi:MAG: hypothetical protein R6X02_34020 [Enhygromyxa sp.]
MKRSAVSITSCVLAFGLVACDKKSDAESSAEAKTEAKAEAKGDAASKAEVSKAPAAKQDEKPASVAEQDQAAPEGTKGVGGVIHEAAGDEKPAAPAEPAAPTEAAALAEAGEGAPKAPADAPHFDTNKDRGSMVGHIASSLIHDDDLAEAKKAMATLASLAIGDKTPSDAELCAHVWKTIFVKEFPDLADEKMGADFMRTCKFELEKERLKLGPEVFAEAAACIMAAETLEAIELCDKAEKQAEKEIEEQARGDGLDKATCEAAIKHVFALLHKEMGDDPEIRESLEADLANLEAEAVAQCMVESTKAEVECALKAQSFADLAACDA